MRKFVLKELYGGLWHTTRPDRFENILSCGGISPEPAMPDKDRWHTSQGKELYPYVRILGGVSLFDFDQFDYESYSEKYPMSSRHTFIPYRKYWEKAVWIEIDREQVAAQFIPAIVLVERWKSEGAYRHTIMPRIEAAHLGVVPVTTFKRVFLIGD